MKDSRGTLLVVGLVVLLGGCATGPSRRLVEATGGAGGDEAEALLAPFLPCTSPAEFVRAQHGVDMPRLLDQVDDWSAVRLGVLGPVSAEATEVLNRKRASFLVTATREYGVALAEVFALFLLHSAFDDDLRQVLRLLARDKQLGRTLGQMATVREQLRRRGLELADSPERPERPGDVGRGFLEGTGDVVSSLPPLQWGASMGYEARKRQLPAPYQRALEEVEKALVARAYAPGSVALGVLDELTFGVPLGFYYLAAGTGQGLHSLAQGQYEQATRELTPVALMVAVYAGGKGARRLQGLESRLDELQQVARRLEERLGGDGLRALARYLQAEREAALLVIEGGEAGAVALHEARGQVPRAQALLSQAKSERPGPTRTRGGVGKSPGGMASLLDETAGLTREVLDARLLEVELEVPGPRLSGNVAVLEKQRPVLEAPPPGARGHPLWSEYVPYFEERLAELQRGRKVKPPLEWEGYQRMRGLFTRGLAFERAMTELLRADAALPRAQRRFLQDFTDPRIETYVGVWKPDTGLRFADVLVIERQPPPGQSPRVETFSFKSRDLSLLKEEPLAAQMTADASEALAYYGETLDIRRPTLKLRVQVQRVRLIYEGGALKPMDPIGLERAERRTRKKILGVEVLFQ
jgi:hypothetical protein